MAEVRFIWTEEMVGKRVGVYPPEEGNRAIEIALAERPNLVLIDFINQSSKHFTRLFFFAHFPESEKLTVSLLACDRAFCKAD